MTSSPSSSYLTVTVENDTRCSSDAFWDRYWREVILGHVILAGKLLILTQQVLTFCAFNHYHSNPSPETINKQEVIVLPSIVDLCMMHWWQHWIISGELWDIPDFKMAKAGKNLVKLRPTMIARTCNFQNIYLNTVQHTEAHLPQDSAKISCKSSEYLHYDSGNT